MLFADESYRLMGACFAAYKDKGGCFTESVYHECLAKEFAHQGIPFASKLPFTLQNRGETLSQTFEVDFFCFEKIILELKAVECLLDRHRAQLINYLHAANCDLGLLVNFGSFAKLEHERLVHSRHLKSRPNKGLAL